jgi:hypothetical protein
VARSPCTRSGRIFSAITQPGTPEQFAKFIAEQSPIWAELVKMSGATIEN